MEHSAPAASPPQSKRWFQFSIIQLFFLLALIALLFSLVRSLWSIEQRHDGGIVSIAFSNDGKYLASSSMDDMVKVWDVNSGSMTRAFIAGGAGAMSVGFLPEARAVVTLPHGSTECYVFGITRGAPFRQLRLKNGDAFCLAMLQTGNQFVVGARNGLDIWDLDANMPVRTLIKGAEVADAAVSHDGKSVVALNSVASGGSELKCLDIATGTVNKVLTIGSSTVLTLSTDGHSAVVGGTNGIQIWDMESGKQQSQYDVQDSFAVESLSLSSDGRLLAVGLLRESALELPDGMIQIWDVSAQSLIRSIAIPSESSFRDVAFAPGGATVASQGTDGSVMLWDALTGDQIKSFPQKATPWMIPAGGLVVWVTSWLMVRFRRRRD